MVPQVASFQLLHDIIRIGVVVPDAARHIIRMSTGQASDVIAEGVLPTVLRRMEPQHGPFRCLGAVL